MTEQARGQSSRVRIPLKKGHAGRRAGRDCFLIESNGRSAPSRPYKFIPSLQIHLCPFCWLCRWSSRMRGEGLTGLHDKVGLGEIAFGQGFLGEREIEHANITPEHGKVIIGVDLQD